MIARWVGFAALLGFSAWYPLGAGADISIPLTLDGFAEPIGGDSASVQVVAQVDSIPGTRLGSLLVTIRVRDGHGRTLLETERVEPDPPRGSLPRLITKRLRAGPGKVRVRMQAKGIDFDGKGEAEFEIDVPSFSREAFPVSTPRVGTQPEIGDLFRPVPSHRFHSDGDALVVHLGLETVVHEIGMPPQMPDSLRGRFVLRRDSRVIKDSTFVAVRPSGSLQFRESPARWGSGKYTFQITLASAEGTVERRGAFEIMVGGSDLLRDPVLVRTVLGYIATGEERSALETASSDSLPSLWNRFWQRRDPSPGTQRNEALDRFLDRVNRATRQFGGVVPGWSSDRGRILIQHGEPVRTEQIFEPTSRTQTEIWYYDNRHTSYVFQDLDGFGNYRLIGGR